MNINVPYETGIRTYSTAQDIYDGLVRLTGTEEMQILSEMFQDVSTEKQGFYYYDKGGVLKEKFEELANYGDKMWIMDLALYQIDNNEINEIHDLVYQAVLNADMAKRIGFKKLFIEHMLCNDAKEYKRVIELFFDELSELDCFNSLEMIYALNRAMNMNGTSLSVLSPYPHFTHRLREKILGLKLFEETRLLTESRALLTSYDDFMLGLRMNQALYEMQERMYKEKVLALQVAYDEKIKQLYSAAKSIEMLEAPTLLALPKLEG
jgi:hypothetical protein